MFENDAAFLMSDLLSMGFAVRGNYTHGATSYTNVYLVFEVNSADSLEAITGQNQNEAAAVTVLNTEVPNWGYGGKITVSSGAWAGTWTVGAHIGSDDSTTTLSVTKQSVVKIRSMGAEKLIGE